MATVRYGLLSWYDVHRRKLPWRGDAPPYTSASSTKALAKANTVAKGQPSITRFFRPQTKNDPTMEKAEDTIDTVGDCSATDVKRQGASRERVAVDPYKVWVSEVMLQQTRVETVIDYFEKWMQRFPTVRDLAQSSLDDVNLVWAGLGYYRRAKLLWLGAQKVCAEFDGNLPESVSDLLAIPGIGAYTAGAIASIAFGIRAPLVDGNVIRVFSRLRAIHAPPDHKPAVKLHWELADEAVDPVRPGDFNQALMELGACICTARDPQCEVCPVVSICWARQLSRVDASNLDRENCRLDLESHACDACTRLGKDRVEVTDFPPRKAKKPKRQEHICACVVACAGRILLTKRKDKGLLAGQWEFPNANLDYECDDDETRIAVLDERMEPYMSSLPPHRIERRYMGSFVHVFTHIRMKISVEYWEVHFEDGIAKSVTLGDEKDQRWVDESVTHKEMALTTGVNKVLDLVKRGKASLLRKKRRLE